MILNKNQQWYFTNHLNFQKPTLSCTYFSFLQSVLCDKIQVRTGSNLNTAHKCTYIYCTSFSGLAAYLILVSLYNYFGAKSTETSKVSGCLAILLYLPTSLSGATRNCALIIPNCYLLVHLIYLNPSLPTDSLLQPDSLHLTLLYSLSTHYILIAASCWPCLGCPDLLFKQYPFFKALLLASQWILIQFLKPTIISS